MTDHLAEARRLTDEANTDRPMGKIERGMLLTEANNHLLWYLTEHASGSAREIHVHANNSPDTIDVTEFVRREGNPQ